MATLQALLFDVDGTLADTERDGHRPAFNMAFKAAGLDWQWGESLYGELLAVTGGKERIRYYLEKFNTTFVKPDHFDAFVRELHASKTRFYTQLMAEGKIPLRTGVERLINEARAEGMRMAIVTTTTPENVTALLKSTLGAESESWFEVIAAGDIVPAKKPAPDIYLWALEQMNLTAADAVAFEDSLNGIKSSAAAGLKTIITINDYTKEDDFSQAQLVLDHMGNEAELFNVLSGDSAGHTFLNLELVKKVHAA
ncbi:Xylulose-1,5-bisphosphate phosphatase CbbY, converts this Rubisco inhibiting byproduct to xylulose-5P [hydrothermal vent metagenome]|uniref:Xylulose-1,5-bisphosphate phosphatase CbbY, converts this Rubisco inhibiting byproduct to xylulose-5P n=1 Tax=hydrothermal vent metagenome TaxID=652676 RepID=A0A3B0W447_9ZZZZ